jgi:hypothetical protein
MRAARSAGTEAAIAQGLTIRSVTSALCYRSCLPQEDGNSRDGAASDATKE